MTPKPQANTPKFKHRVGSHSDDRGGESDFPCYCQYNGGIVTADMPQAKKTISEIVEELFEMGALAGIGKANIDVHGAKRLATKAITQAMLDALPKKYSREAMAKASQHGFRAMLVFNDAIDRMESAIKLRGGDK